MLFFSLQSQNTGAVANVVSTPFAATQANVVNNQPVLSTTPTAATTPFTVIANGNTYYPQGTPNKPTYNYNPQTQQVTVPGVTINSLAILGQTLPKLSLNLPVGVTGDFQLTRGLGQQPTATLKLFVPISQYDAILTQYQAGNRVNIGGIGFAVQSLTVVQGTVSETLRHSLITIQLIGQWAQHLTPQPYNLNSNRNPSVTTLQTIAGYGGASLLFPIAPVVVPRRSAVTESFDWAATLDGHALYNQGVIYWSNPNGISIRTIRYNDPPQWVLGESDLLGGVNISYPEPYLYNAQRGNVIPPSDMVRASVVTGIPSLPDPGAIQPASLGAPAFKFTNTVLSGDYFASEAQYLDYTWLTALGSSTSFVPRTRVKLTSSSGSKAMPSWASGNVKTLSASSDITGYTQNYTLSTTIDGQPEYELTETWGFKIPRNGLNQSAGSYWGIIERREKTYSYGIYGYLTGYQTSGFKSLRFETPDPKAAPPTGTPTAADNTRYNYSDVPIRGFGYYQLEPIDQYYPSTGPKGVIYNPDGSLTQDETYIPEYFIKSQIEEEFGIEVVPNPGGANLPQLTKGKEYVRNESTKITDNGLGGASLSGFVTTTQLEDIKLNERYRVDYSEYNAEGGNNLDNVAQNSGYQEYQGRPGTAPGLPPLYKAQDQVQQQLEVYDLVAKDYQAILIRDADYIGPTVGNVNYSEARTIGQAQISAQTDWLIQNIRNGVQVSFQLPGEIAIAEGDKIWLGVNGKSYIGWVVSASTSGDVIPNSTGSTFVTDITIGCPPNLDPALHVQFQFIPKDQISQVSTGSLGSSGFSLTSSTTSRLR